MQLYEYLWEGQTLAPLRKAAQGLPYKQWFSAAVQEVNDELRALLQLHRVPSDWRVA